MSADVPQGTIAEVLAWVGDDPGRARAALDAERAGQNRSTLINQLEAIAVSEETIHDVEQPTQEELAPEYPTEVAIEPGYGTTVSPVHVRDADVEVPEDADITPTDVPDWQLGAAERASVQQTPPEGEEPVLFDGEQVEYFQAASSGAGMVLSFNGNAVILGPQQVAQLKQAVDRAVVGLAL
jgi:hypothetical protein